MRDVTLEEDFLLRGVLTLNAPRVTPMETP